MRPRTAPTDFDFSPDAYEIAPRNEYVRRSQRTIDEQELTERDTRAVVDRLFLGFEDL